MVCYLYMGSTVSTVTSKFQVTLPDGVREKLPIAIGDKIHWEVQGDMLVGKRLPSLMDLAGCLKSDKAPATDEDITKAWADSAVARDKRSKK